ncbi:MAG TPA: hypothetical protein DCP92_11705 [Nitrospiraceae bacterium]|nr:hypothetical protein [Nitrospiraceae bacterium]
MSPAVWAAPSLRAVAAEDSKLNRAGWLSIQILCPIRLQGETVTTVKALALKWPSVPLLYLQLSTALQLTVGYREP